MLTFQDPTNLIPGIDALKYGDNGLVYTVLLLATLLAVVIGGLFAKVLSRFGKVIEVGMDKQATATENQATEQKEMNTHLKLLIQQSASQTKEVLQQHETSTSIILSELRRGHGDRPG